MIRLAFTTYGHFRGEDPKYISISADKPFSAYTIRQLMDEIVLHYSALSGTFIIRTNKHSVRIPYCRGNYTYGNNDREIYLLGKFSTLLISGVTAASYEEDTVNFWIVLEEDT